MKMNDKNLSICQSAKNLGLILDIVYDSLNMSINISDKSLANSKFLWATDYGNKTL